MTGNDSKKNSGYQDEATGKTLSQAEASSLFDDSPTAPSHDLNVSTEVSDVDIPNTCEDSAPRRLVTQAELDSCYEKFQKASKRENFKQENVGTGPKRKISQEELDYCYQLIAEKVEKESLTTSGLNEQYELAKLVENKYQPGKKRFKPVIGVDIGETTINIVHMVDRHKITHMEFFEIPSMQKKDIRHKSIVDILKQFLIRNQIKTKQVVVTQSNYQTSLRIVQLPKLNKSDAVKALNYETKKLADKHAIEELSLSNLVLEKQTSDLGAKLLLIATLKKHNIDIAKMIKLAGLQPIAIDMDAMAIGRFYNTVYENPSTGITVLVEMRTNSTLLSFIDGERFSWAKHISVGGMDFTTSIANTMMVSMVQAEQLKRQAWSSEVEFGSKKSEVARAMQPVFDRLVAEIRRMIQFYLSRNNHHNIFRLVLGGASSKMPNLAHTLAYKLKIPVIRWELKNYFDFSAVAKTNEEFRDTLPHFASVLGLCLWDKKNDVVNFLPSATELKHSDKAISVEDNRNKLTTFRFSLPGVGINNYLISAVVLILVVTLSMSAFYQHNKLEQQITQQKQLLNAYTDVNVQISQLRKVRGEVVTQREEIEKLKHKQILISRPLAFLSKAISDQISPVNIKIDDGIIAFTGYSQTTETLDEFIRSLIDSGYFRNVEVGLLKKSENYNDSRKYFKLVFSLK